MDKSTISTPPAAGEAAHTPTPWVVTGDKLGYSVEAEYEPHGRICGLATQYPQDDGRRDTSAEKANAAFIVRAVNSHAALVAALDKLVRHVDGHVLGSLSKKEINDSYRELNKASDEARAALNAAKS